MSAGGPGTMRTPVFEAERLNFAVEVPDGSTRDLLIELFGDLHQGGDPSTGTATVLRMARDGTTWVVHVPGGGRQRARTLSGALALLLAAVNVAVLDASSDRLHIHAAGLSAAGRGVVIAAARGTGKTTTAAHLAYGGWSFLTDETVYLGREDGHIGGTARPLSIKPGGSVRVPFLARHLRPTSAEDHEFRFVAPSAIGAAITGSAAPHVVVLLRRPAAGPLPRASATSIHPADAVVGLMEETLDAERFGRGALRLLAQLAASSHCAMVLVGSPSSTADVIRSLADGAQVNLHVSAHAASEAIDPRVESVRIGDRAVIHQTGTGRVVALNELGTELWEHLAGWTRRPPDLSRPEVHRFVDELRGLDLLRPG